MQHECDTLGTCSAQVLDLRTQGFASLADAPVGLVYKLKTLACHWPGHEIAYVRQAGAWVRADDARVAAVGDDLHSVVADMKERGWLPRVLFYVARAGGA